MTPNAESELEDRKWQDDMSFVEKALAKGYTLWIADNNIDIDDNKKTITIIPRQDLIEKAKLQFIEGCKAGEIPYFNALVEEQKLKAQINELNEAHYHTEQNPHGSDEWACLPLDYIEDRLANLKKQLSRHKLLGKIEKL